MGSVRFRLLERALEDVLSRLCVKPGIGWTRVTLIRYVYMIQLVCVVSTISPTSVRGSHFDCSETQDLFL